MKPRFLADANVHQGIVDGVLRWNPDIDFQTASMANLAV
jgi:hypothetical protein